MKDGLHPAFSENNVPVVFSSNDAFVPVLSVMLRSIIDHASEANNYDVIVLSRDISGAYARELNTMVSDHGNFSLRIVDITDELADYALYTENRPEITVETYFRLVMPDLMKRYPKALYLDGDMIANCDVAELYAVDVSGHLLAASYDCDSIGRYHKPDAELKEYRDGVLKLKDPDGYFCAGVLAINLDRFRQEFSGKDLMGFAASYPWRQHDQDVLNVLCQGKTKLLSPAWDLLRDAGNNRFMPSQLYAEFLAAEKDPKIVHYGGKRKPWIYLDVERGEYFWKYAGQTPFYRQILSMVRSANDARYSAGVPQVSIVNPDAYKDEVLRQFAAGKIGFRYIWDYFKAWLKYKLK